MPVSFLHYKLLNGYNMNWLVAGPQTLQFPIDLQSNSITEITPILFPPDSGISQLPVERGPIDDGTFQVGDFQGVWKYFRCDEDRLIHFPAPYSPTIYLRTWAFSQIKSRIEREAVLVVTTFGPVDIWLNDVHIHQWAELTSKATLHQRIPIKLKKGNNSLLLRLGQAGSSRRPLACAVRICKDAKQFEPIPDLKVVLPSTIPHINRRNELENAFRHAFMRRDVFTLEGGNEATIGVEWPAKVSQQAITCVRLQTPAGRIYAQSEDRGKPGDKALLEYVGSLQEGAYDIDLIPVPREYYEENVRIKRTFPIWITGNHAYSKSAYGNFQSRKAEALAEASRRTGQLFVEIAKMALDQWEKINLDVLNKSISQLPDAADSLIDLAGLLGMLYRYSGLDYFPREIISPLEKGVINYPFIDSIPENLSEGEQILYLACKLLAGQKYSRRVFSIPGIKGKQLKMQGERDALNWMYQKGQFGFIAWDSDEQLSYSIIALSHLIDLADSESVFDIAGVLLDKILIGMAVNSFQGGLASSTGQGTNLGVSSAHTRATAGISRLFWGQGIFNHFISAYVSAACMANYELPSVIEDIASSKDEIYGWEKQAETNKTTYRTTEFMLSSVSNYKTGERGSREILWQATLGPEAIVFVNHPGSSARNDSVEPCFWLGNAVLPRIAQHKDVVLAIYNVPSDDWMGFTHAYFPTSAFDEYKITKKWAFARKADGYLAITASPLEFIETGQGAYRELRCSSPKAVWICQMGSLVLDGDFKNFQKKVANSPMEFMDLAVNYKTLRGDNLHLDWAGNFLIDGQEQTTLSQQHFHYPFIRAEYPCHKLEVEYNNYVLRLNFLPEGE